MCTKKELLECTDIGATTFAKFRVELTKKAVKSDCKTMYELASICLPGFLFTRRFKDGCFMSFRIREDNGYVVNSALLPTMTVQNDPQTVFKNTLSNRKLRGKFHLEVLFVDANRIADAQLSNNYAANINARMGNISDDSCLKDKVKKAEKWRSLKPEFDSTPLLKRAFRFLQFPEGDKSAPMLLEKWFVALPKRTFESNGQFVDRAACYAIYALEIFKKSFADKTTQNTHNMYEFMTNNGSRIVTKLRPHLQNSVDMISESIRKQEWETLTNVIISRLFDYATIYNKLSGNENVKIDQGIVKSITLEECSQIYEKKCDCKKLHVSSYCNELRLLFHKKTTKMALHSWQICFSDLCSNLFDSKTAADLYSRIANRISRKNCKEFRVGTNIQCEIIIGEKMYSSELRHHSDIQQEYIRKEMFTQNEEVELVKKIVVTVYVIDVLAFPSNENAHECLNKLRSQKAEVGGSNITIPNEPRITMKKERKTKEKALVLYTTRTIPTAIPLVGERKVSKMLDSNYFKMDSSLAIKALTNSLTVQDAYRIVSSHISMNTCKSRIMLIQVKLNPQFYEESIDSPLLLADILLDIANSNEIGRFSGEKKKLTLGFMTKDFPFK